MPDWHITRAPARLTKQIAQAMTATFEDHRARHPHAFPANAREALVVPAIDEAFRTAGGKRTQESAQIYVALQGEEMAGYILLPAAVKGPPQPDMLVHILDIYVAPEFRGTGVAEALMAHVEALAEAGDLWQLSATVWSDNAA